jgi:LPS-assembly lipoprotein
MPTINLLTIILLSSLISACGFHTPTNVTTLNVAITGKVDTVFATELKKHFDVKATQSLTVQIGDESQQQQATAYEGGSSSSQALTLGVPVTIWRGKKLLLSTTLSASTTISELSSQADRLQTDASYVQLRSVIVTKLLRRLKALN